MYLASYSVVLAYTFGPVQGGKCDSCDIWIDAVDATDGGRVNLKWGMGWGDAERDILEFVSRNCTLRGYQASASMGRLHDTEGIWFPDKAKNFTCNKPDTFLENEYGSYGAVSSLENNAYEIQQVADRSCQKRSLGNATVKRRLEQISSRTSYDFECHQPQQQQEVQGLMPQVKEVQTTADRMTITKAKEECVKLGRKPKTEKFGNCVLELTK